ncbi:MAG: class I SAM-dependent RNA methyltransferase [Gemmatimonadales bacterium]|nr:MAG: class I SAM-dependent RNA methyltransferase [Gemmatimonadales bacterium]
MAGGSGSVASRAVSDPVVLDIRALSSEGAGIGSLPDGRVVFVHRTAPGDRVEVEITQLRRRWGRGRLVRILTPGPHRRSAPCPHQARCGGCPLEHLEYPAQLDAKKERLEEALRRIGKLQDLPSVEVHPSPREFRYRNRVSFTLRRLAGARVVAGFHEVDRPDRIMDVDEGCLLPEEPVARAWGALRRSWGPGAGRLPPGGELRLTLRGTAEGHILLLVEGGHGEAGDAGALLGEVPGLVAVWHRAGPSDPPRLLAGEGEVEEQWLGELHPVRPGAFLQVNRGAAELLHDLVLRELAPPRGRTLVDAYCGIGVYGRRAARHGGRAVGIELDPQAAEVARARAPAGFRLLEGAVEARLAEALPADLVVLNPPRSGVADGVMERLAATPPERMVYVSCDPATLARDLARLGSGFRIGRLQAVDLFPQTAHIETVVTLDRTGSPSEPGNSIQLQRA